MTKLVTGASGQLGLAFRKRLTGDVVFANSKNFDFLDPKSLQDHLDRIKPDTIINCAAYTAVEDAEAYPELAFRVNSDAVGEISKWCAREGAFFVHYSTDYVFDGEKRSPYTEQDLPNPLSTYGRSKRDGEELFLDSGCNGFCLRTSWLHSRDRTNFFLTMLRLLNTKEEVRVVNDQVGIPTTTDFLADMTLSLMDSTNKHEAAGMVLHACASGQASWYDFAVYIRTRMIIEKIPVTCKNIVPVSSEEFAQSAKRPRFSVLSNKLITSTLPTFDVQWHKATDKIFLERDFRNI